MSQDGKDISVTLKAGTGFDAPWIVVYGNHPDEVSQKLNAMGDLIAATVETANLLKAANNASPIVASAPPAPVAPPQQAWGQPQQNQAPVAPPQQQWGGQQGGGDNGVTFHPEGKLCQSCGSRVQFKSITSKASGKKFDLWTCPNQRSKGDGHFSEFAN